MGKGYSRADRVSSNINRELATVIARKISDPDIGIFTISEIKLSGDYSIANVYISVLNEDEIKPTVDTLNSHAKFLRMLLAKRMNMRTTPALRFVYDDTLVRGSRVASIIHKVSTSSNSSSDESSDNNE